jgi:hypothetical protein
MEPKVTAYKNLSSSSARIISPEQIKEIILNFIPEKTIINDLKNLSCSSKHNFSNISNGKCLYPNSLLEYSELDQPEPTITLYAGGFGQGYYHEVRYNIKDLKYVYYVGDHNLKPIFWTDSWNQLHKYVSEYCENLCS